MIRVAILGAGIGAQHFEAYQKLSHLFSVEILVDQQVDRAKEVAAGSATRICSEVPDALDDPRIDVVDICLPPHLHVPVTLEALAKGKHVICEKPLATSLLDVDRIKAQSALSGKQVFPVFQYRWGPGLAKLRHLINSGFAGTPFVASVETHWNRGCDYYAVPWRGTWAGEQGGAILGHAIHNHDLLTQFMGPVRAVSAALTTRVNSIETEDCAAIVFEFESGALATSNVTLGAATDETRLRIIFENVTATSDKNPYAPGCGTWTFSARDPVKQNEMMAMLADTPSQLTGFEGFFTQIASQLAGKPSQAVSFHAGAASIELVTAIYAAARSGQRVQLPFDSQNPLFKGWNP